LILGGIKLPIVKLDQKLQYNLLIIHVTLGLFSLVNYVSYFWIKECNNSIGSHTMQCKWQVLMAIICLQLALYMYIEINPQLQFSNSVLFNFRYSTVYVVCVEFEQLTTLWQLKKKKW
jgi:hypothetical protein